jgi:hypothetical protein
MREQPHEQAFVTELQRVMTTTADTSIGNLQGLTRAWSRCPHGPRCTPHSILCRCGSSGATPLDVGIELPSSVTRRAPAVCPSVVWGGATSPSGSSCRDIKSRRRLSHAQPRSTRDSCFADQAVPRRVPQAPTAITNASPTIITST